jgi:RNA polymerase sigma-70 factor, ECF subfamily
LDDLPGQDRSDSALDQRSASERLFGLIQSLKPLDRQVIVSWLEGMDAVSIGEVTGLSPPNVAMKVHRIKAILTRRFHSGVRHAE